MINAISMTSALTRIAGGNSKNPIAARTVSESEACTYGGNVSINGEVDDATSTGNVVYQLNNCEAEDGEVLNGQMYMIIHSDINPESNTLGFNELSLTQNGNVFLQTGTIKTVSDAQHQDQTINLFSSNGETGEQIFFENFRTIARFASSENINPSQMSGKIYSGNEGYVTVSSSDDLALNYYTDPIPESGHILLLGASGSKARISPPFSDSDSGWTSGEYRVDLDKDGDGTFELTALQNINTTTNPTLADNQNPEAFLQAFKFDFETPYAEYSSHPTIYQGDTIYLYGSLSNDPENDLLTYQWTVELAPTGSNAGFLNPVTNADNTFVPDVHGVYQISLKVTEIGGTGSSSIAFFDFDTSNQAPEVSLVGPIRSNYGTQTSPPYEAGYELGIQIDVVDIDTPSESSTEILTYSYELVEQPAGSSSAVTGGLYDMTYTLSGPGKKLNGTLYIKPDLAGTYTINLTATDHEGATATKTINIEVVNNPPTLLLKCDACANGNEMISGQAFLLSAEGSYDAQSERDYIDTDIEYVWSISSDYIDPAGLPFETITVEDLYAYTFSAPGPEVYSVTLSGTDPTGLVTTVDKDFLVNQ